MMTYYGVWSGREWWNIGNEVFHTTVIGLAKAQAMVVNSMWKRNMRSSDRRDEHWEVCVIGEDGLPAPEQPSQDTCFEVKREFLKCAMAKCAMCGEPAKEWVDVRIRGWMCEQHSHVSMGCLSEKEET